MKKQKKVPKAREKGMVLMHRKYYLNEYKHFDGECYITFNIVSIDFIGRTVNLAITNRGRISVVEYDIYPDRNGQPYFEYGPDYDRIYINEFKEY